MWFQQEGTTVHCTNEGPKGPKVPKSPKPDGKRK